MNLLSSLSTSQLATRCQEDRHLVARGSEFSQEFKNLASVTLASRAIAIAKMWIETTEDYSVLLNDTIVSKYENNTKISAKISDRPLRFSMPPESLSGIEGIEIEGYQHNSDSERLLVGSNQQQISGRYRQKSTVPQ
ncbi:hypothetical protein [Spirulina sp. 06S082]|uniref:hypothetical protein n=1 Tax=Spirulina sp. 06S082 TaxID=3110248 RepID=UPI002B20B795|nr:hypothetical protein [Spirulina sp. 06S082]MEA5469186.1 hypothetical protein [Spirulina sp. 06S082]